MTETARRLEYVRLDEVEHAPRNPKGHDGAAIARAIEHHGFGEVPLRDERTGRLVAGHGRHAQLVAMHAAGASAPDGIEVDTDGMWLMPLVAGWSSRSDADAEAYLVGSNQITTLGGWDDSGLADMLRDLQAADLLDLTGFGNDDVTQLLADLGKDEPFGSGTADEADDTDAEPPAEPVTQLGDVWTMGPHRLVCGDSTDARVWDAVMAGALADMVWTDPPYGVSYAGSTGRAAQRGDDGDREMIENDDLSEVDLSLLLQAALGNACDNCVPGAVWYVAAPPGPLHLVFGAVLRDLDIWRQTLAWVKDSFAFGRSDYHYRHEPIFYGWKPGAAHHAVPDRTQDTVWEIDRPRRSAEHPTMKPVTLVTRAVENSSKPGGLVVDPFGGSGTTLLACQITGRVGRLIELDPAYCDVIARRWQELTGELPYNERLGEPVDLIGLRDE